MIENLPSYISIVFILTTLLTLFLFYNTIKGAHFKGSRNKATTILSVLTVWLIIQAVLTIKNVYSANTDSIPPKILLFGILPIILVIIFTFLLRGGRQFIDSLRLADLTYLNIVRVPVELVLFWLYLHKAVPQLMTFEGRNFDIIAGITAPFVAYFGLANRRNNRRIVLIWNIICLVLLLNIIVNAFLSAPSPLQKFAFDQPNISILYFPFSWLPTFIVPVVLFGHLVSIRQLVRKNSITQK